MNIHGHLATIESRTCFRPDSYLLHGREDS